MLTEGMDPGLLRSGVQELKESSLREGRGCLGTEGIGFLSDSFKLPLEMCEFIQGIRAIQLHSLVAGEGVRRGVIHPAMDDFPSPEQFEGLVGGAVEGKS